MIPSLAPEEARILGCLLEKEIATPEYYPLTLNSLVAACNQKSCREPTVQYEEALVRDASDRLRDKGLLAYVTVSDSRAMRHRQRLTELYPLDPVERSVLTELLLRGPQTPGELRSRAGRLATIPDIPAVQAALDSLATRADGAWVTALAREPGRKEIRYQHLLSGAPAVSADASAPAQPAAAPLPGLTDRVAACEAEIASLRDQLASLRVELDAFRSQFG